MILLFTGLLAGALDAVAAVTLFLARGNRRPGVLFQYIASAVYGPAALGGGARMVLMGLCFHFLIALCWVGIFFALYPRISWLRADPLLVALVYGFLAWVVMNLVVLPLSKAVPRPFSLVFSLINIIILVVTIGLPCVYLARH